MEQVEQQQQQEQKTKPTKSLNARIEDLVIVMEKTFSYRASFVRGIFQGLGFIIGSTIIAGIAYSILTNFVSPEVLHDMSIDAAMERSVR